MSGQDVHFSQFYSSPLTLNPSETGNFNGDWRIASNYRTQWRAIDIPYNTFSLSYDRNFTSTTRTIGAGLLVLHDQSGNARINSDRIQLSAAVHSKIDGNNLHAGLQAGVALKSFDISSLTFPDQYDNNSGVFNPSLANNEVNFNQKKSYFDINIGVGWDRKYDGSQLKIGFAVFHLNRPNESFYGSKFKVPMRKVFNLQYNIEAGSKIILSPKIFVMGQARASEYLLGSNFTYLLESNKIKATGIYIGSQVRTGIGRNTDAVMGIVGMTFERLELGLSYDVNISNLKQSTNKRGAVEIALIFWSGNNELKPKTLPCDRF